MLVLCERAEEGGVEGQAAGTELVVRERGPCNWAHSIQKVQERACGEEQLKIEREQEEEEAQANLEVEITMMQE